MKEVEDTASDAGRGKERQVNARCKIDNVVIDFAHIIDAHIGDLRLQEVPGDAWRFVLPFDAVSHDLIISATHSVELQRAHQFENLCPSACPPEPVIAGAVADQLMGEPKRASGICRVAAGAGSRLRASQNIDDHRGRADAVIESFLAGSVHCREAIGRHTSEDGDHLPIPVIGALQSFADLLHRGWQNPFPERSAVAQSAGFASEDRNIVPGIIDVIATAKAGPMFGDRHPVLLDDKPISIGVDLDRATDGSRQDGIFVVVEANGACLRHRRWHAMEAIEGSDVMHEAAALGFEHLPDSLRRLFGVAMGLGIGNAFVE